MNHHRKLLKELEKRFNKDHQLSRDQKWEKVKEVYHKNSEWLKGIILQEGWPSSETVGEQGELYAWLIIQYADDVSLQKECLKLLERFPKTKERKQYIAYLTDRILITENKAQVYGTQFSYGKPFPVQDKQNLDKRRSEMGLEPLSQYTKRISRINSREYEPF